MDGNKMKYKNKEKVRLQKYMAQCGVASRRHSEELIRAGKVMVNGKTVTQMGVLVSDEDEIRVDGVLIKREEKKVYIMLNKPSGYVTTVSDPRGRRTVLDLIDGVDERFIRWVVLIMIPRSSATHTSDGVLPISTHRKMVAKTYLAEVKGGRRTISLTCCATGRHWRLYHPLRILSNQE